MNMNNVADLKDPKSDSGRTYREVNSAKKHSIPVGALVEIIPWDEDSRKQYGGVRLYVVNHARDCDGTPLYTLNHNSEKRPTGFDVYSCTGGYSEDSVKVI